MAEYKKLDARLVFHARSQAPGLHFRRDALSPNLIPPRPRCHLIGVAFASHLVQTARSTLSPCTSLIMNDISDGTFGIPADCLERLTSSTQSIVARLLNHKPEPFDLCVIYFSRTLECKLMALITAQYKAPNIRQVNLPLSSSCYMRKMLEYMYS